MFDGGALHDADRGCVSTSGNCQHHMEARADTILIVDPDLSAGHRLGTALDTADISWSLARSAFDATEGIATGRYGVLVADLAVPLGDLQELVEDAGSKGTALVCTGTVEDEATWRECMRLGARSFIRKPLNSDGEAVTAVRTAIQAPGPARALRHDLRRLQFQYQELSNQFEHQSRSYHDTQETFFLDLSRMMTIISNIMDGIVFADRDGNITLMNPVAEDLLGAKAFLAIGKPVTELTGNDELLKALRSDHERMAQSKESTQTIEVHHSLQDLLYIRIQTSRVLDYKGEFAGILSVLKDVTADYKSDQLKNQYLSIVAHELRTPLTGIKTFSTMMTKGTLGELSDKQLRVMESIREQSLRLEHQIDKLINLGHLESNEYGQDLEVFDLSEFASSLVAPFEQPAKDRNIDLRYSYDGGGDVQLDADRSDLRRACQALIENAVKFTPDGGRVTVEIVERDGELVFRVADSGIGVDPRYHRRIFEKFFQVEDPLTRHHGGAGLGLFVAQGIVEAHGSRIEVSSQLGQGAEFSFVLPVYKGPEETVGTGTGASDNEIHQA